MTLFAKLFVFFTLVTTPSVWADASQEGRTIEELLTKGEESNGSTYISIDTYRCSALLSIINCIKERACRIKASSNGNVFDDEQWPTMIQTMTDSMIRLEAALKTPLLAINKKLKAS